MNAVRLENGEWFRIDPRGNKKGINSQFTQPLEKLAFPTTGFDELIFPHIWPEPLPVIIDVLEKSNTWSDVIHNLPDLDPRSLGDKQLNY